MSDNDIDPENVGFKDIHYQGKPVERDGYTAKNYMAIPIAIEHNSDGSVTICKEICDEIYNDPKVPLYVRNMFKPTESIFKMVSDKMEPLQ
jgi:hypothetical protein